MLYYFTVDYTYSSNGNYGQGTCAYQLELDNPIKSMRDIEAATDKMEKMWLEQNGGDKVIMTVTFWKKFE